MLVIKAFLNYTNIDNILIHNTGIEEPIGSGVYAYELVDPVNNEILTDTLVYHKRTDGYRKLLIKVLELLDNEDISERTRDYKEV